MSAVAIPSARCYSTSEPDLKTTLKEVIPAKRELLKKVKANGNKVIGEVKIENTIGGMRYIQTPSSFPHPTEASANTPCHAEA